MKTPLPFTRSARPGVAASNRGARRRVPRQEPFRIRGLTRFQWLLAVAGGGAAVLYAVGMAILLARWFVSLDEVHAFLLDYPGTYAPAVAVAPGFPAFVQWQHFFNTFLIVLIIRTGLQVRAEKRPGAFWSSRRNPKRRISLNLWFHNALDVLWLVNGVVFVVLLFVTGHWVRLVPTSLEVFPNALSAGLQYLSLNWPTEGGWANYNSLQQLAYFTTVFIAAPLAAITGVRMSGVWPKDARALDRIVPIAWARALHFPVMLYFVVFIVVHVALVFATGALRNLNHMYAGNDGLGWAGFWIFAASTAFVVAAWIAARPVVLVPLARLFGTVKTR